MTPDKQRWAQEHEADIAAGLDRVYRSRVQPGSGNQSLSPNDVAVSKRFHVECKYTSSMGVNIQHHWLVRVMRLALQFGVRGFVAIRFKRGMINHDYFVIPADDFYHLLQCEKELDERSTNL